jgi:peptidoglycan hydrolase-like protein with peptidoglycan-binding domain
MTLAEAQARLNALGYPVGKADGVMGARTHVQLRRYQKAEGLPQTGELDADTAAALSN